MKDYKMTITDKRLIPNILDHAILLGYAIDKDSIKYLVDADNLIFRTHSFIGQCTNRMYGDLHEDYVEILPSDFMKLTSGESITA